MKQFLYHAFTMFVGLVFIISLCTLDTLHPVTICALFASEAWIIHVIGKMGREESEEDVQD